MDHTQRFRSTVLAHTDAAHSFARYLTRDASAAEDVVQEALLSAFRGFDGWRGGSPKAWLLTIVRNCFLASVAAEQAQAGHPWHGERAVGGLLLEAIDDMTPERILAQRHDAAMLRTAVERLPEPFRETLVLRELEELSYKEIASIIGVPVGTVMSRLARARHMLTQLLLPGCIPARGARLSACFDNPALVHGPANGELDATRPPAAQACLETRPGRHAEPVTIRALRTVLAQDGAAYRLPPGLADRLPAALATL